MESKVELLVPVRTWDALKAAVRAGADAVELNRQSFIFNEDGQGALMDLGQLRKAVTYVHAQNVKLYIAVNTLLSDVELQQVAEYLPEFEQLAIDGLGIRDLAMLNLVQKMEPTFSVYADQRMQISNVEMIQYLHDRGVERVELARGITREQVVHYLETVDMELTYLIAKELCRPQSKQALHSGIKDLLQIGIHCIKLPDAAVKHCEDVQDLVGQWRRLLDTDDAGVGAGTMGQELDYDALRELSIAWAYGDPWTKSAALSGDEELNLAEITEASTAFLKEQLLHSLDGTEEKVAAKVTVAVPTFDHFLAAVEAGAERILIDGDYYIPGQLWSYEEIATAISLGYQENCEVVYRAPGVVMEAEMFALKEFFEIFRRYHLRVMTGNPGVVEGIYGADLSFTLFGDLGLDAHNSQTFHYLRRQGYDSAIISQKAGVKEVCSIGRNRIIEVEMLAQGPIPGCGTDAHLAVLPVMGELARNGISNFRIEGGYYSPDDLVEILNLYRKVIRFDYDPDLIQEAFAQLQTICRAPLTYGALVADPEVEQSSEAKAS